MDETTSSGNLRDTLARFVDAFNRNDLDSVMSFFADNAVFSLAHGEQHLQGKPPVEPPPFGGSRVRGAVSHREATPGPRE